MKNNKQELLDAIEKKRAEMNVLSEKHPLSSDTIIKVSQELDLLLNQYQALIAKNERNGSRNGDNDV